MSQPAPTCRTAQNNATAQHADVLIIGQGIAGSVLAYTLAEAGLRVRVVDNGHRTSSSTVAAGMVNPVLGQRLNKAWEIEQCLPVAIALYTRLEQRFGKKFFHPRHILKLINTEKEAEFLQKRLEDPSFQTFLGAFHPPHSHTGGAPALGKNKSRHTDPADANPSCCHSDTNAGAHSQADTDDNDNPAGKATNTTAATRNHADKTASASEKTHNHNALRDEFGSIEIKGGGYLDTIELLTTLREHFREQGILIEAEFRHADLDLSTEGEARWQDFTAKRIIFAEGWRVMENPLFAAYAFQATKGQILTVEAEHPLPDYVVNRSKWLIPQHGRQAWIGSTYERDETEPALTDAGRREILTKVQAFLPRNTLSVQAQRAGIRLACHDHIPRAGFLPTDARIGIFNAFSSKGNCFAPFLAKCMAEHLIHGTPLPVKADIAKKKMNRNQPAKG